MNKKLRKLILPVSILAASNSYALGLGNLQVNSALDEVLNGQIPLIVAEDEELTNIKVSLASQADYERVNLDKSYVPTNIRVNIAENNNGQYIELSSQGVVNEPIVTLLLVVDWANGHLLREYTLLLDPPLFNNSQIQQNYSEPVQTQKYQTPEKVNEIDPVYTDTNTISSENNVSNNTAANTYTSSSQVEVKSGDTLWKIANEHNRGFGTSQQMMVAIFNNNPTAFINNDMNNLKKGVVLDIPTSDQVAMISNSSAIEEVKSQTQNWTNLQTQSNNSDYNDSSSSADFGIELVPPNDSDNSDSINSYGESDSSSELKADLNQAREQLASSDLKNSDLTNRVEELEKIVKDQDLALSLKDTSLAELQQQLNDADSDVAPEESTVDTVTSESDDVWDEDTQTDTAVDTKAEDTVEVMDDNVDGYDELTVDDSTQTDADTVINNIDEQTTSNPVDATESQAPPVQQQPPQEQSLMEKMLAYKTEGLIGLGAILLGLVGFFFMRNRRKDEELSNSDDFLDSVVDDTNAIDEADSNLQEETELNLAALDQDQIEELSEESEQDLQSLVDVSDDDIEEIDLDDEPEVIVMNDDAGELDLDSDIADLELNESDEVSDNQESELALDEEVTMSEDEDEFEFDDLGLDDSESESEFDLDSDGLDLDDLDFEMDDSIDDTTDENVKKEDASEAIETLEKEFEDLSFDLDDEIIEEESAELSFNLDEETGNEEELSDAELSFNLDEELGDVDLEDNLEQLEFDLGDDLELDLGEGSEEVLTDTEGLDAATDENSNDTEIVEIVTDNDDLDLDDIGLDLDDIGGDDAVETKLDLAKAYFEMGDTDGAKEMIAEIIQEGNDGQIAKAEELSKEING